MKNTILSTAMILGLAGCAGYPIENKDRGLVMDQDSATSRGGVANYVFRGSAAAPAKTVAEVRNAETAAAGVMANKAPAKLAALVGNKIEITQQVSFDTGKATLTPSGKKVLDEVASVIQANTGKIKKVNIEGHTDHVGAADMNQSLSERRAATVKQYLASKGISNEILNPKGFGSTKPKYEIGKSSKSQLALNRRVEFECEMQ